MLVSDRALDGRVEKWEMGNGGMGASMRIDIRPRQAGKTYDLVKMLDGHWREDGLVRIGVFRDLMAAMQQLRQARENGYDVQSWQFISHREFREQKPYQVRGIHGRPTVFLIDDLDEYLRQEFRGMIVEAATMTMKDVEVKTYTDRQRDVKVEVL